MPNSISSDRGIFFKLIHVHASGILFFIEKDKFNEGRTIQYLYNFLEGATEKLIGANEREIFF